MTLKVDDRVKVRNPSRGLRDARGTIRELRTVPPWTHPVEALVEWEIAAGESMATFANWARITGLERVEGGEG